MIDTHLCLTINLVLVTRDGAFLQRNFPYKILQANQQPCHDSKDDKLDGMEMMGVHQV